MNVPRLNLYRDGHEACAEHASSIIRKRARTAITHIFVAPDGGMRCAERSAFDRMRPESELIGCYRRGVRVEEIEDDLLEHFRGLSKRRDAA